MLPFAWLFAFISVCAAVWDDEAFEVDWELPQVGKIHTMLTSKLSGDVVHVVSEENILASLYMGEVQWRVILDGETKAIDLGENIVTAVNGACGSVLSVWDHDGFLVKELATFEEAIIRITRRSSNEIIIVLHNGDVLLVAKSGELKKLGQIRASDAEIQVFDNGNFVIHTTDGDQAGYAFYNGLELATSDFKLSLSSVRERYGSKIVYETDNFYAIQINQKIGKASKPVALESFEKYIPLNVGSFYAFERNHNLEVFTLDGEQQFIIPNVFRYDFKYINDVFVLYTEFHANIIDADTGDEIISHPLGSTKLPFDDIEAIHTTTDGVERINTLIQHSDGVLKFIRNSNTHWEKDYSLFGIIAHAIVHLDVETQLTSDDLVYEEELNLVSAYLFRWRRHLYELRDLYQTFWKIAPLWASGEWSFPDADNKKYFGFEKLLILASKTGQVVAISTVDGKRIWSFDTQQSDILKIENFGNEHIYVITKSGPLYILEANSGELVVKQKLVSASSVTRLQDDSLLLETKDGFDIVIGENSVPSFTVKHDAKSLKGVRVHNKNTQQTWSFEPSEDEIVVAYAAKNSNEEIANIGIVLGNRDVLYKYLYPNVAVVAIFNQKTKALYLNLVDTLTGEILHSAFHDSDVRGDSVSAVFGEYWVVYTYYSNRPTPEQKVVVIDLFESLTPNVRFSSYNSSSFEQRVPPAVSTRSFVIPQKVTSLGLTKSRFGVTTKAVVFGLSNGQVLSVPKFILNSRRVVGRDLTNEEKQEFMLLSYDPILNLDDKSMISHKRQVLCPEKIVTVATNLESTSIVCSYGLDIFCTRVAPSSQFDKLTSSFDKVKLIASIAVMTFLVYFLRPIRESKLLKNLWVVEPVRT
jgi:outer membrane protein assembly factor BamB